MNDVRVAQQIGGLVVDVLTLGTLGVTSLILTLAGFWAGRYGETTGRDRRFAPIIAVGAITLLAGAFGYVLHYLLDEDIVARHALLTALAPAFVLNLILNGNPKETSAKTVDALLKELNLLPTQVAVEQNGTVLFRQEFEKTAVNEGDRIEIIRVVAGG